MGRIRIRKSVLLGGSALMLVLSGSSGAMAQCTNTVQPIVIPTQPPFILDPAAFVPIGTGASVNSLVSVLNTVNTAFLTQTNAFISSPPNPAPDQLGGGVWGRGIGGRIDSDNTGVTTLTGIPGSVNCNTTTRNDFAGYQFGTDLARLNAGGWNLHAGVTVGYMESDAKDITVGGTFSGKFQVPFAGVYAAATYGGFFLDAQVRGDFYESELTDPALGLFGQRLRSRGTSATANVGYNMPIGTWFIEPSAGVVWSRLKVDPLNISGTLVLANSPGLTFPGTIQVDDIDSFLGRASLRVGTNVTAGNFALQPFVTASVFHEFEGDVTTNFSSCFGALGGFVGVTIQCNLAGLDVNGTLSTSRVGTYGQFALGVAGQLIDTGWLGYVRADFRTGENIEGWSVNGGIRYQFTPEQIATAIGKGPVLKAPAVAAPVPYNWTGFYLGAYAGTTFGSQRWTERTAIDPAVTAQFDVKNSGLLGGGQVGFNYQMGRTVIGLEADGGWSNASGAVSCPNGTFFFNCEGELNWLASVTGRLGVVGWDRILFYAKGGLAVGEVQVQTVFNPLTNPLIFGITNPAPIQGTTNTQVGWTAGAGFEFALAANWSAKAEYMYFDLGDDRFAVDPPFVEDVHTKGNIVRVGVNYHFNPVIAPVVSARY
jgi:opacity protein-like surface antigen